VVEGENLKPDRLVIHSSNDWIQIGAPEQDKSKVIEYPCKVRLPLNSSVNAILGGLLVASYDGKTIAEHRIELESAEIDVTLAKEAIINGIEEAPSGPILRGFVAARYGIASVTVNDTPAKLNFAMNNKVGEWSVAPTTQPETLHFTVIDQNGNKFTTTKSLPVR
jgi:hypothetical protein